MTRCCLRFLQLLRLLVMLLVWFPTALSQTVLSGALPVIMPSVLPLVPLPDLGEMLAESSEHRLYDMASLLKPPSPVANDPSNTPPHRRPSPIANDPANGVHHHPSPVANDPYSGQSPFADRLVASGLQRGEVYPTSMAHDITSSVKRLLASLTTVNDSAPYFGTRSLSAPPLQFGARPAPTFTPQDRLSTLTSDFTFLTSSGDLRGRGASRNGRLLSSVLSAPPGAPSSSQRMRLPLLANQLRQSDVTGAGAGAGILLLHPGGAREALGHRQRGPGAREASAVGDRRFSLAEVMDIVSGVLAGGSGYGVGSGSGSGTGVGGLSQLANPLGVAGPRGQTESVSRGGSFGGLNSPFSASSLSSSNSPSSSTNPSLSSLPFYVRRRYFLRR